MWTKRLVASLIASSLVALVAAAGLAGSATSAAADGVYFGFGYHDGPRMPPPPRWGWGPPPPPMWGGRPGWRPGPPPMCRPRWVDQPVVDPWGRIVRYQRVEIMDCGPGRHHRPRW